MQTDPDRLQELAAQYSTHADFCEEMAEHAANPSIKENWLHLAATWIKLAEEAEERSRLN